MAGTKRIRYQWMWHQLKAKLRKCVNAFDETQAVEGTAPIWIYRNQRGVLELMDRLENDEYQRVFNEEEYENKTKGSVARKRH